MSEISLFDCIVLGGGPAGLAAGLESVQNNRKTLVLEKHNVPGGISRTVRFKNYYFDLGGHRFFTRYNIVQALWDDLLPLDEYVQVKRLSRIYYRNKYFHYPLKPLNAFVNLGIRDTFTAIISYIWAKLHPIQPVTTFRAWVSNHFGRYLFHIFFETYTEKVWGVSCDEISAEWAAQRIKKLSLFSAILNAFFPYWTKGKIKTLVDEFQYPKYGPGMMYEAMTERIRTKGGEVWFNSPVIGVNLGENGQPLSVKLADGRIVEGKSLISTIPISEFVHLLLPVPPQKVLKAASDLLYRSFLIVALIIGRKHIFPDNWVYIHSPEVKMGRMQNVKNWSPFMVPDANNTLIGCEYFCNEGDDFWSKSDEELGSFAAEELRRIRIIDAADPVLDSCVVRVPKAYPVYFRDYQTHLSIIKEYLSTLPNVQVAGRCGMFKYNNMDHSILTGILAARNLLGGKEDVWAINADDEYHEEIKKNA